MDLVDKKRFKNDNGKYLTQSLFLEISYDETLAVYTLDGEDKDFKGKHFPSLKKLYLEMGDLVEYDFATTYLYDWTQWQKLLRNNMLIPHIEEWREELRLSLRSEGLATMINLAKNEGSYQAAKFLMDEGYMKTARGRPSKAEIEAETKRAAETEMKFKDDFTMLDEHKGAANG
jgi:hypothetical protein